MTPESRHLSSHPGFGCCVTGRTSGTIPYRSIRKEAEIKASRKTLLGLVEEKFDIVPKSLKEKLLKLDDADILNTLSRKIINADSLDEFEELVDKALK